MIPELRKKYNEAFTEENYHRFLEELGGVFPGHLDFRVAETPVFVHNTFRDKMVSACDHILEVISGPEYKKQSMGAIPEGLRVPNEDAHPHFIAFDFGVCLGENGELVPQLIEMQGFPSLFAWEVLLPEIHRKHFWTPSNFTDYLSGFDRASYIDRLRSIIIGSEDPRHVILLEVFPHQQKTRVDFYATELLLGIKTVCLTEIIREGRKLFYMHEGEKLSINRIYNRVIFDDLFQQSEEVREKGRIFQEELDLTWVPHPNWFYRISKYTLPFIRHPYVPHTEFLSQSTLPEDLENYVVKPLFSFAGQGVIIDVTREELDKIPDPQNWIIQRKVAYAPAVATPDDPAKVEIRLFYFWEEGALRPLPANNLARLSKGKMIGVRYNKDRTWVGGSFCLFEP